MRVDDHALAEGWRLYRARRYWHAHEAWEHVWLSLHGGPRDYVQGLIQVAAVALHLERHRPAAAQAVARTALLRLHRGAGCGPWPVAPLVLWLERVLHGESPPAPDLPIIHHEWEIAAREVAHVVQVAQTRHEPESHA